MIPRRVAGSRASSSSRVAVEEAPLLAPVQRAVGGVHVQHDALGRLGVRSDIDIEEHLPHRLIVDAALAVAAGSVHEGMLQPVARGARRQSIPCRQT
jgi:hypothetical protein